MSEPTLHTPSELVAAEAVAVAVATARFPNLLREAYYQARVQPLLNKLTQEELEQLHRVCGFSHGIGWAVLSQALGIVSGHDKSREMGERSATPLYTPKHNTGGWVRLFRSKAAVLPLGMLDTLTDDAWASLVMEGGEERLRGLYGIPSVQPMTRDRLRSAIQSSDLFEAPWMAAVWRPDHGWTVIGAATSYLEGKLSAQSPDVVDLFRRPYGEQVPPPDFDELREAYFMPQQGSGSVTLFHPGPALGIEGVIHAIEFALSKGYRLDLIRRPVDKPIDSWEGGIAGVSKTPLMGVQLLTPAASFLIAFQVVGQNVRIEGLDKRDYELFKAATGVDASQPLGLKEVETLVVQGIPVWGRIPSFFARADEAQA